MNRVARNSTFLRTRLRPSCLAVALALGTLSMDSAFASSQAPTTAQATFAVAIARHPSGPALSAEQQLSIIERAQIRQGSLPAVPAASISVTNCNDSGAGSYRQAMTNAVNGDTIDMTNVGCSSITLTTGDVVALANNLTLQGPGQLNLTINGNHEHSQVRHAGTGTLRINDLTLINGDKYLPATGPGKAAGGCVSSEGTLILNNAGAKYCEVRSPRSSIGVKGGALYSKVEMVLIQSIVSGNHASATGTGSVVSGGGLFSAGPLTMSDGYITGNQASSTFSYVDGGGISVGSALSLNYASGGDAIISNSTISGNSSNAPGARGSTGGLFVLGNFDISNSTISGNSAGSKAAVYLLANTVTPAPAFITNTTISGNHSNSGSAGLVIRDREMRIANSTIAFNTLGDGTSTAFPGAGIQIRFNGIANLRSTIVSNNTTTVVAGVFVNDLNHDGTGSVTGDHNLIPTHGLSVPPDTRSGDPMLQPLAFNGGSTDTHKLGTGSDAINRGSNPRSLTYDQRGIGYPRVIGPQTDIGAFESSSDVIFANGFD